MRETRFEHLPINLMNSNTMTGLKEALKECDTFEREEDIPWAKIAENHKIVRLTLTRR